MGENLAATVNEGIATKTWAAHLSSYTQSNCSCSLTDDGYRIYRPPNKNPTDHGNTMWGGFVMSFYEPPFTKTHRYGIYFDVKGQTSNSIDSGWSNYCGWGGGGLSPSPSNNVWHNISGGFNSQIWTPISYEWTINDDVYKTCTSSYSSFVQGTVYPSYRDFKYGFDYRDTGALGTDLYIRNVRMYDLTTGSKTNLLKEGIMTTQALIEPPSQRNLAMLSSGEIQSDEFIEI